MTASLTLTPDAPPAAAPAPEGTVKPDGSVSIPAPAATPPAAPPETPPPGNEPRPEWLPEKFKTPADLAAAYAELERKQSAKETPATPATPADPRAAAVAAGVDVAAAESEYLANGALSAETMAAFKAAGLTEEQVTNYVEGQKARADQWANTVFEIAGGAEAYETMAKWAVANFTPEQRAAFDRAITSGDAAQASFAVESLTSRYTAANGKPPKLANVNGTPDPGVKPFASNADLSAAMKDPRYRTDAAYRESVYKRAQATVSAR